MKKLLPLFALLALCGSAQAAEDTTMMKHPPVSKEMREKMAAQHEQMAACLRTDKDMMECHQEMQKSCSETMGDSCPMMKGMMGKKRHEGHERNA